MAICFYCKSIIYIDDRPSRSDECPRCGSDLWVCKNCRFYDEGAYNMCREPLAEYVADKERANFCEYFELRDETQQQQQKEESLKRLKELFNKE